MDEFLKRRKKLASYMEPNSIAILVGAKLQYRNADVEYPFRQDSDVYYLSGINEPNVVLVLQKNNNDKLQYMIFYEEIKKGTEIWVGEKINKSNALKIYGADQAYPNNQIASKIPQLLSNKKYVYYAFGLDRSFDNKMSKWLNIDSRNAPGHKKLTNHVIYDIRTHLHEMRVIKSKKEIEYITAASKLSASAHNELIKYCKPGLMEYQMAAKFNCLIEDKGCCAAYPTIVGAGNNACTLHYTKNNCKLKKGDLVLVDAGCEYNNYASDITRTYPVSGKFSLRQKDLYQVVLEAQKVGISFAKPGSAWNIIHEKIVEVIIDGLIDLKILKGKKKSILMNQKYKNFYLHSFGHLLGLDVHDVGKVKVDNKWRVLKPGMLLTIEPGIYISNNNKYAENKWRGMGIRIEDTILVTEKGNKNLTKATKKEVKDTGQDRLNFE